MGSRLYIILIYIDLSKYSLFHYYLINIFCNEAEIDGKYTVDYMQNKSRLWDEYESLTLFDIANPHSFRCLYCKKPFGYYKEMKVHMDMCELK